MNRRELFRLAGATAATAALPVPAARVWVDGVGFPSLAAAFEANGRRLLGRFIELGPGSHVLFPGMPPLGQGYIENCVFRARGCK